MRALTFLAAAFAVGLAVAAGSVFVGVDPWVAAIAGVIIGAPTALAFNTAQGGTRVASTATTGGLGNPILSFIEDALAFFATLIALVAPILVPVLLVVLMIAAFRLAKAFRSRLGLAPNRATP